MVVGTHVGMHAAGGQLAGFDRDEYSDESMNHIEENGQSDSDISENDNIQQPADSVQEKRDAPAKKRRVTGSKKDMHRPPTVDELNSLRDTQNLFHSNLFQLQITEMLKEITPSPGSLTKISAWIEQFRAWLSSLPTRKARPITQLAWLRKCRENGVQVPLALDKLPAEAKHTVQFGFEPPTAVVVAGALADGTLCVGGCVDLLIEMPATCVQPSDVINARFVQKRALYLTYLAWRVRSCALVADVQYSLINEDPLRPVLVLTMATNRGGSCAVGVSGQCVRVLLSPPTDRQSQLCVFKSGRLSPRRSNLHSHWLSGDSNPLPPKQEPPTARYNSSLLADALSRQLLDWRCQRVELLARSGRQAVRLLSVWLRQRGLGGGGASVCDHIMIMFLLYLHNTRRISPLMSGYQMLRTLWSQLVSSDWSEQGVVFVESASSTPQIDADKPAVGEFHQYFDVVFVDPSGYHNMAADMSICTYRRLRDEAARALSCLDSPTCDSFQVLFMTPMPFIETFDHVMHVNIDLNNDRPSRDCPVGGRARALCDSVVATLHQALTDRVLLIDYTVSPQQLQIVTSSAQLPPSAVAGGLVWPVTMATAAGDNGARVFTVSIGVRINADRLSSTVDRGPLPAIAATEGATAADKSSPLTEAEFRRLYGDRVQIRRFQDGQVQLAVHWPATTMADKRMVVRQIVLHVLRLHHGIDADRVVYCVDGVEDVLSGTRVLPAGDSTAYGTGEECELRFLAAFQQLSMQLRRLRRLPLVVSGVYGVSPTHRHAAPFPPLPDQHHALSGRSTRHGCSQLLERQTELAVPWCPANDVIIQLEQSGKWPQDPEAVRRVRTAFHLQMCEELRECGLTAACQSDSALVIHSGYIFRLCVTHARQPVLSQAVSASNGMAIDAHRHAVQLCRLTSSLAGLQNQYPAYSCSCRLAVRWVSAHMMSALFPDIVAELLMAEVFLYPAPFTVPQQPCVALLRWLRRLATFDWQNQPLLIDFTSENSDESWRTEMLASFSSRLRHTLPPLVIYTSYDHSGTSWTGEAPCRPVLIHAQKLAWQSLAQLSRLLFIGKSADWRVCFRPPLDMFHVIVRLKNTQRVRRHEAIDARGPALRLDVYQRHEYEALPPCTVPDPVSWLVNDLRSTYNDYALFWYDACGGDSIGVLLRPGALSPRRLTPTTSGCAPEQTSDGDFQVAFNMDAMLDYIRVAGSGIVEDVVVHGDKLSTVST